MNQSIKGYLFDYGGTLDTVGCHWGKFIWHSYKRCQVPVAWEDFREAYILTERELGKGGYIFPSFTFRETLRLKLQMQLEQLQKNSALPANYALQDGVETLLADLYGRVQRQMEVNRPVLEQLSARVPLALVSNFYGNLPVVVREMGLEPYFQTVVESAAEGIRKPDPRLFQIALERLHLSAGEVMVVGDSLKNDILPAHSLGCRTAWLPGEGWNNDERTPPKDTLRIASLRELVDE